MVDIVNRVETLYKTTGIDTATAAFDRITASEERLARMSGELANAVGLLERSQLGATRSLDLQTRSYDPLSKAVAEYERFLRNAQRALSEGAQFTDANVRAQAALKAKVKELTDSLGDSTGAVRLNQNAMLELGHIGRSVFDEIAAGRAPLQAVQGEFGRIAQVVGEGGLSGVFGAVKSKVLGLIGTVAGFANPFTLGAAAVAIFGVAVYTAYRHTRDLEEAMNRAVTGVGRITGLSGTQLGSLATAAARPAGLSVGDARSTAAAFAQTGRFEADGITRTLGLVRGYAGAYGTSNAEAGGKLAELFRDPSKGLDELNKRFGFLDDRTRQTVASLTAQGDAAGALRVATDAAATSLNEMAKPEGTWGRFTAWFSARSEAVEAGLNKLVTGGTELDRYAALSGEGTRSAGRFGRPVAIDPNSQSNDIAEDVRNQARLRLSQEDQVRAAEQSTGAGRALRAGDSDVARYQGLVDRQAALQRALDNPTAAAGIAGGLGANGQLVSGATLARQELDRVSASIAGFKTALQQLREEGALSLRQITARTEADRAAVDVDRARTQAISSGRLAAEADTVAEQARAQAIARDTVAAVDAALPDLARQQSGADRLALLRGAAGSDAGYGLADGTFARAAGNTAVANAFNDPARRTKDDYDIAIASADAFSTAEKAAVEARRAELAVLRETGDATRAQAAAQMAVNEAIGKANRDAEDRLGMAKQNADLVGLSPYARGLQEIENRYEGYGGQFTKDAGEDRSFKTNFSEAIRPVAADMKTAGQLVVDALRGVAGGVSGSGTVGVAPGSFSPARAPVFAGSGAGYATPEQIADASARTGIPANVIAAIGKVENGGRLTGGTTLPGSDGRPSSAYGYGQLTNGAAADVARAVPGFDKYNPNTAVFGSAEYLSILSRRNNGDLTAALNAYGGTPDYAAKIARAAGGGIALPATLPTSAPALPRVQSTALASDRETETVDENAYARSKLSADPKQYGTPLGDATRALDAQRAATQLSIQTFGQSAAAVKGAQEQQALWNRYVGEGITPTGDLAAAIKRYGATATQAAQDAQDAGDRQRSIQGDVDGVRGFANSSLSSLATGLAHGKNFHSLVSNIGQNLGDSLINRGVGGITGGLFGKQGQSGGGLFGGSLSSLFSLFQGYATGTDSAPGGLSVVGEKGPELLNVPRGAQVIPNNLLGRGGSPANHFYGGDVHLNAVGGAQFSPEQMDTINTRFSQSQRDNFDLISRNFAQVQSDAQQTSPLV